MGGLLSQLSASMYFRKMYSTVQIFNQWFILRNNVKSMFPAIVFECLCDVNHSAVPDLPSLTTARLHSFQVAISK